MTSSNDVAREVGREVVREVGRDVREVVRDEPVVRGRILAALADGPLTIPELADRLGHPSREVVCWVMGMRKYGYLAEDREAGEDGFFRYRVLDRLEP